MSVKGNVALFTAGALSILLLYLPLVLVVIFSFNSAQRGMVWESFSTKWYQSVWMDPAVISSLRNTLLIACATAGTSLVGGFVCGYAVGTSTGRTFSLLLPLLFIPAILPDLVVAMAQSLLFQIVGLPKGLMTVVLSQSTFGISYVALFVVVRIKSLPYQGFVIASQSLGASAMQIAFDHFRPIAFPPAIAGTVVVAAMSAQDFVYAFFCGGPASTTLSVRIYGMVKFGVNSGVNVVYVLLVGVALLAYLASEAIVTRHRSKT